SLRAGARRGTARFALQVPELSQAAVRAWLQERALDRYVVLSPGGGWRAKCWPAERFGPLCQRIFRGLGLRCVVNVGPRDVDLADTLCNSSGDARPLV